MQRVLIISLISILLLLKLKKRCFFKFIKFVKQETIKKKTQQKVNINKRARI